MFGREPVPIVLGILDVPFGYFALVDSSVESNRSVAFLVASIVTRDSP